MNTGICTTMGRHPPSGLIFSFLYSSIIAWFIFCRSPEWRSRRVWIRGESLRIRAIDR